MCMEIFSFSSEFSKLINRLASIHVIEYLLGNKLIFLEAYFKKCSCLVFSYLVNFETYILLKIISSNSLKFGENRNENLVLDHWVNFVHVQYCSEIFTLNLLLLTIQTEILRTVIKALSSLDFKVMQFINILVKDSIATPISSCSFLAIPIFLSLHSPIWPFANWKPWVVWN